MTDSDFQRLSEIVKELDKTSQRLETLINKREILLAEWKQIILKIGYNEGTN